MSKLIPNESSFVGFTAGPVGVLAAPTAVTATAAAGSGTLVAGTYNYIVTSINDTGESLGSTVATVTTTSTGGVTVAWTNAVGATGVQIYGRGAAPQKLILGLGLVTSWLDSGAYPVGTQVPPTVSTGSNIALPTAANIAACENLTPLTTSVNFSSQGNNVPTPALDRLFETSILGTSQATATADFYRDNETDTAWNALPRKAIGFIIMSRFSANPVDGSIVEVWPVRVTSRAMANMTNNTVETFTVTFAVPSEPNEAAVVTL